MKVDIKHIAKLAKLHVSDDEITTIEAEMEKFVTMVENLPELEDKGAMLDPSDTMNLRADVVQPSYPREEILANAPKTAAGCIMVPKTVD